MSPQKDRKPARQEFAPASPIRTRGRSLRKMLHQRVDDANDSSVAAESHGDAPSAERWEAPPPEDRAG